MGTSTRTNTNTRTSQQLVNVVVLVLVAARREVRADGTRFVSAGEGGVPGLRTHDAVDGEAVIALKRHADRLGAGPVQPVDLQRVASRAHALLPTAHGGARDHRSARPD